MSESDWLMYARMFSTLSRLELIKDWYGYGDEKNGIYNFYVD